MRRASFLLFFLLIGSLAVVTTPVRAEIPGQWMYPGWHYRVPIVLYNPNNYSLTNYQLELEINSSWPIWTNISKNGSDIRFTTLNGSTINYYVENWNYTAKTATVWVKVPSLPALSYTTIYMYYGNQNATSESNPNKVFIWFDNASTDKSADYAFVDLYRSGLAGSTLTWEPGRYTISWTGGDTNGLVIKNLTLSDAEIDITFTIPSSIPANYQFGAVVRYSSAGVYYLRYEAYPHPDDLSIMSEQGPPTTSESNLAIYTYSGDNSLSGQTVEIRAWARGYELGVWCSIGNGTVSAADPKFLSGEWGIWFGYDSGKIYVDKIVVRKYADKAISYSLEHVQEYKPPSRITLIFHDKYGNTLNNVYLTINGTSVGFVNSSTVLSLYPSLYSLTAAKQYYVSTTMKLYAYTNKTVVLNLTKEIYTVIFYAYDMNNTKLNNFSVYANGEYLGTFNSGGGTQLVAGDYLFKFVKNGYRYAIVSTSVTHNGTVVTFSKVLPASMYEVTFNFYSQNGTVLNAVTVLVDGEQQVLNSGSKIMLNEGNYTLAFSKPGYENSTLRIELTSDTVLTVYLQPASQADVNLVNATKLVKNITSYVSITPINPYAKAFMDSGGSFGDTIKLALRGDSLMRLILPQVLILAIVIVVLVQTTSPLAALGGALIGWAMSLGILGEAPSLRNSGMTFMLIVFLVAWTLWDLFYNYSRET